MFNKAVLTNLIIMPNKWEWKNNKPFHTDDNSDCKGDVIVVYDKVNVKAVYMYVCSKCGKTEEGDI